MKLISINSTSLHDFFFEMANALEAPLRQDKENAIYRINIPSHMGDGHIEGFAFEKGIAFINFICEFYDDLQFYFHIKDSNIAKFHYLIKGEVSGIISQELIYDYQPYQPTVLCLHPGHTYELNFKRYVSTQLSCLDINYPIFIKELPKTYEIDKRFLNILSYSKQRPFHPCTHDLRMYDIHRQIFNFSKKNFLRTLYVESKVLELAILHIKEYVKSFDKVHVSNSLLPQEIENLKKIPEIIEENLSKKYKIEWYATEIGMNINKFQKGFQELYKVTVNKYIQLVRLKKAEHLLRTSHLTISEIVDIIGLSSKSHFSKVFKENYHISPSNYRKTQRITLSKSRTHENHPC